MKKQMQANLLLVLTAFIWGSAFVAQSAGMDYVRPFTYNMSRNVLGFLVLLPVIYLLNRKKGTGLGEILLPDRLTLIGGICCGVVLAVASGFQQYGVSMTTAGKAGFITALYIILVPVFSSFLGKKPPRVIWLCVVIALVGFYLLCVKEGFTISTGDLLVLCCAFCFTAHILVISHFSGKGTDGVKMSCIQFAVAGLLSAVPALIWEHPSLQQITTAWLPIAYAGIMSSGVAYTLQIVAMKDAEPTTATLIMSLESVFAALSGWLILGEQLSGKELLGCILVFAAVILAQAPLPSRKQ